MNTLLRLSLPLVLCCMLTLTHGQRTNAPEQAKKVSQSLVKISTTAQFPDYVQPWTPGHAENGRGAGFVVKGERIMTNAHVVSNARFLLVEREGDPKRYIAEIAHIAHDCDLALLKVKDKRFFQGLTPLEIGEIPAIDATVSAYGYPIGGRRLSVTRGVVSRIDFRAYSHSGVDAHLAIQIDAAINPGNSGGPVMQSGKVVGVAFQGLRGSVAENAGYMIPPPVIKRFLRDIEDGTYDGYVDLSISYFNLLNPARRASLGLPDNNRGVVVTDVLPLGSCDGILKSGDVLLAIDDLPIYSNGFVELAGERVRMPEVVERKLKGDEVKLTIIRDGKRKDVTATLKPNTMSQMQSNQYDIEPRYLVFGGLVFQPLTRNLILDQKVNDLTAMHYFQNYLSERYYLDHPDLVIIGSILSDPVNTDLAQFKHQLVKTVNGKTIKTFEDVAEALAKDSEFHVIETIGGKRPLIFKQRDVEQAHTRIRQRYNIQQMQRLGN